jgi:peptide/nickel transport system ATP-binding protein
VTHAPSAGAAPPQANGYSRQPVLKVSHLRTYLYTRWGITRAVDDVSLELFPGETLGIVGESGSGKSMLALSLVRLTPEPASSIEGGEIILNGRDVLALSERAMRKVRGKEISMILQDPQQSLNPVYTIGSQLAEAMRVHDSAATPSDIHRRSVEALENVHVPAAERRLHNYPHEISGGMKQRVVGAMAMAYQPQVLIADEPTTALDVTIQAQYLRLLKELQEKTGVAILLITHDFGVVAEVCDRVAVMYAGRMVEQGPVEDIFDRPRHPYTRALLASRPRIDSVPDRLPSIEGQPPALHELPEGCRFAPRCSHALDLCRNAYPEEKNYGNRHIAACWRAEEALWPSH